MKWNQLPYKQPEFDPEVDTIVRQSTIGQLQLCPGRVGFENHPGYLQMISEPLAFGTCVHQLISQDLLKGELQEGLLLSMHEWVNEILVEQYDWDLERVPNIRDFFGEISLAYALWRSHVLPILEGDPIAIEQEARMFLGAGRTGNIWLQGTADAVYPTTLVDWKTASRGWKQAKADFSVQASLYMPLHKQALEVSIQDFTFWVFDRSKAYWSRHKTRRSVAQINAALATALQYGRQLEAQVFPCTPVPEASFNKARGWYCSAKWCGAWNVCDAKFMNDGIDEKVVAIRSW